ncbi:MAG: peptidylprolyl isomerase [Candidatus Marinimicrobia bacterium]|nr:peptidylprolyl isomerase [Candidatus Neomarinimicrobiota bacterium]
MNLKDRYGLLILGTVLMLLFGCEREIDQGKIIAEVDGRKIAVDEFVLAYEYAPTSITQQAVKVAYDQVLEGIIDRVMLAGVGRQQGLEADPQINRIVDYYRRAAIVRELFIDHIRKRVEVSDNELRKAYQLSKITLLVKHYEFESWAESKLSTDSLLKLNHQPLLEGLKTIDYPEYGLVDLIGWNDLRTELESILYKLELGQPSEPIWDTGKYHVFIVVDNEQEILLTENDYIANQASIATVIRRRKEHRLAFDYVREIMAPQQLRFKSDGLTKLSDYLWQFNQKIPPELRLQQAVELPSLVNEDTGLLKQALADFGDYSWTIEDFIFHYSIKPLSINYNNRYSVSAGVKNATAIYIRDFVLSEQGLAEGLAERRSVIKERRYWSEQLLADRVRREIYTDFRNQVTDSTQLEKQFADYYADYLSTLRGFSESNIDTSALYSVVTSSTGLSRKINFVSTLLP